jgi:hypothetical protein
MNHLFVLPIENHRQVYPRAELVGCDDGRARQNLEVPAARSSYRQAQNAVVAYQPVNSPRFESITSEKRAELPVQPRDPRPQRQGQRIELSRRSQAHPIIDTLKFQGLFLAPSAFRPLAADDGRRLPAFPLNATSPRRRAGRLPTWPIES